MHAKTNLQPHNGWQWLIDGWHTFQKKTHNALTYFAPEKNHEEEYQQRWAVVAADVTERKKFLDITLELPGVEKADLLIEVVDDQLVVAGEKQSDTTRRDGAYIITERAFGSFQRVITLPCAVDPTGADANYKNGVLSVRLPKKNSAQTRKIMIGKP